MINLQKLVMATSSSNPNQDSNKKMPTRDLLSKFTSDSRDKASDEYKDLNKRILGLSLKDAKKREATPEPKLEDIRKSRWDFRFLKRNSYTKSRLAAEEKIEDPLSQKIKALSESYPSEMQRQIGPLLSITNDHDRFTYIFGLKSDKDGQRYASPSTRIFHGTLVEDIREDNPINYKVSVKRLLEGRDTSSFELDKRIERQISIWEYLNHDNIVRFAGVFIQSKQQSDSIYLASDYAIYGNVREFLQGEHHREEWASSLVKDVINGMEYLHSGEAVYEKEGPLDSRTKTKYRVFHGDIKPTNILVGRSNGRPIAWISDFDFAGELRALGTVPTYGTQAQYYISPEIRLALDPSHEEQQAMREKGDIFALGLTVYEMMTGIVAFGHLTEFQIEEVFHEAEVKSDVSIFEQHCPKEHDNFKGELFTLFSRCWAFDAADRPSMVELAQEYRRLCLPAMS